MRDLCYICLLCVIVIVTFFSVLMPQPALLASLDLQSMQLLHHISVDGPSSPHSAAHQYMRTDLSENHLAVNQSAAKILNISIKRGCRIGKTFC